MQSTKERPLRRIERALNEQETMEVIDAAEYAVISTADTAGNPYGVAVNPVYMDGAFYFHTTAEPGSRRNDNILMNPSVSLLFVSKAIVLPEWYSVDFASAVVTGQASRVEDPAERARAMMALVKRYAPQNSDERNAVQMQNRYPLVALWRVDVERIVGKARAAKHWQVGKTVREKTDTAPSAWLVGVR